MAIRIPINLATDPFRKVRPVIVGAAAIGIVLVLILVVEMFLIRSERAEAADDHVILNRLTAQLHNVTAEQQKLDVLMHLPENAEVLDRSVFLNLLIQHKAISWTKMFADLATVMPHDVRLVAVRLPQVDNQNHVWLDMTVASKDPGPVVDLVKRLEASPQFSDTQLLSTQPPSQTEPFLRARMSVSYAQKL